jgi:hypothetical protein
MSLAEDGRIVNRKRIGFGLMGSELVRLAAGGRVTIESNRVVGRDRAPCGDAELDAAQASLAGSGRGARPKAWVGHPRPGICDAYLDRLATPGAVRPEQVERLGIFPVTRLASLRHSSPSGPGSSSPPSPGSRRWHYACHSNAGAAR